MSEEQYPGQWRGQHPVTSGQADTTAETPAAPPSSWQSAWSQADPRMRAALIVAMMIVPVVVICCGGVIALGITTDARDGDDGEEAIPFDEETVEDPALPEGTEEVRTEGEPGEMTLTYEVTYTNGAETDRELIEEEVTREPVTEVTVVGTREEPPPEDPPADEPEQQCDPNYAGACVPIASDVDCAGGSGDGPAYLRGPVRVVGTDIYGLDADGDGVGCD